MVAVFLSVVVCVYVCLIVRWCVVLYKHRHDGMRRCEVDGMRPSIALVVACKNEASTIEALLKSVDRQRVLPDVVLVVDDHSTDCTCSVVEEFAGHARTAVRIVRSGGEGKKAALLQGVEMVDADYVAFTDADCVLSDEYFERLVTLLQSDAAVDMVLGEVHLCPKYVITAMDSINSIEMYALQATTAAGALEGKPFMCNGADMVVRRSVYCECASGLRSDIASGDDMFMLHAIKRRGGRVVYHYDAGYSVSTGSAGRVSEVWRQRSRWAGKTVNYTDKYTIWVAAVVVCANISLLVLPWLAIYMALGVFVVKMCVDLVVISLYVAKYHRDKRVLRYYFVAAVVYPFYVCALVVKSLFGLVVKKENIKSWK